MQHALYYPSIEFQSPDFLKKAMVVWDRVFRIVPSSYRPADDSEVSDAVHAGAVVDLEVSDEEKRRTGEQFIDFYDDRRAYASRMTLPAGLSSPSFTKINPEKIEGRLLPLFEHLSRATTKDGFMEVRDDLVGGYMFFLASVVAEQRSLQMLTDNADTWTVGTYFSQHGNFSDWVYNVDAEVHLCNLAIDGLLPSSLSDVPMDDLLRFRESHEEERQIFRKELTTLQSEIRKCNSREHAAFIRQDVMRKFEKAKTDYRKTTALINKRDTNCIFSAGVPAAMGFLSLPGGDDPYSAIRLGAGVLIGAIAAMAARNLLAVEKDVGSYLVSIDDLPNTTHGRLHRLFEEFMND